MKSGPFIKMIAEAFTVEAKTVTVYARALKEAGLLTTGARGVNAPDMTPLDAARMTIALLACDGPAQAVERVRQFGRLQYSAAGRSTKAWREMVGPEEFASLFQTETLEDVLAYVFGLYQSLPVLDATHWFNEHRFALKVMPFQLRAEFEMWVLAGDKIAAERIIPFQGKVHDERYPIIRGGIRVERAAAPITLNQVAVMMGEA